VELAVRILIADDNTLVRRALHSLLEESGYTDIVEAEDGEDAVAKAREVKPTLIILDLAMPSMDGLRAARMISRILPSTAIVMHTLHWSPRVAVEAMKVGVSKVVPKSDRAMIIAAVQEVLQAKSNQPAGGGVGQPAAPIKAVPAIRASDAKAGQPGDPLDSGGHVPKE
jgi:DNA-binding NarL/FixJ family response regulator